MLLPVGVTAEQYARALLSEYTTLTRLSLLTLEHAPVSEVSRVQLSGQVNWLGVDADVSRTAQVDLLDPDHELDLDADSPDDGAVYPTRLLSVEQTIISPLLPGPATVPTFCGPLVLYRRDGDTLSIEAQGKEQRSRTDHEPLTCRRGMLVTDAIVKIAKACGERLFGGALVAGGVTTRLARDVTIGRKEELWPWRVLQKLARSVGMQLFYDGRGVLVLREPPTAPVFAFTKPTSLRRREHDWTQVYNRVEVKGRRRIGAVAVAPAGHPFSPERMAAHGQPWERTYFYEDDQITTKADATRVAARELGRVLMQNVGVEFNHPPVWHLEPEDPCLAAGDGITFGRAASSLANGDMTVGYTAKVRRAA